MVGDYENDPDLDALSLPSPNRISKHKDKSDRNEEHLYTPIESCIRKINRLLYLTFHDRWHTLPLLNSQLASTAAKTIGQLESTTEDDLNNDQITKDNRKEIKAIYRMHFPAVQYVSV